MLVMKGSDVILRGCSNSILTSSGTCWLPWMVVVMVAEVGG